MELTVRDTILYVPAQKGTIPFVACHPKTKHKEPMRPDGEPINYKVTPEEMEKLWK